MANLVDQIFEQAKAGSAQGQSLAQPFIQGMQLGQEQQRINLASRQQQAELAQLPLKMTVLKQQADIQGLQFQQQLNERQNYIDSTTKLSQLNSNVKDMLDNGNLLAARTHLAQYGLDNPVLLTDPRYQAMSNQLGAMNKEADLQQYHMELVNERLQAAQERAQAARDVANIRTQGAQEVAGLRDQFNQEREQRLRDRELRIDQTAHERILSSDRILQSWQTQLDKAQTQLDTHTQAGPSALEKMGVGKGSWETRRKALQQNVDSITAKIEARQAKLLGGAGAPAAAPAGPAAGQPKRLIFQNGQFVDPDTGQPAQ